MNKIVFILLLFSFNSLSQKDELKVDFIFPNDGNYEIRVNQNAIYDTSSVLLAEGTYFIEIWNPGLKLIIDTISILPKNDNVFRYGIKVSDQHEIHKMQIKRYNSKRRISLLPYLLLDVLGGAAASIYYAKGRFEYAELLNLKNIHDNNLNSDLSNDEFIKLYNDKSVLYNRTRLMYFSLIGFTALSTSFTIIQNYRYKRKNKLPSNPSLISPFTSKDYNLSFVMTPNALGFKFAF